MIESVRGSIGDKRERAPRPGLGRCSAPL